MILLAQSHCHLLIFSKIIWNLRQYKKNISWNQISRQQFLNCLLILLFWLAVGCQSTMVAVSVSSMMKTFRFVTFDRIERGKGIGGGDMRMGGVGWRRTQLIPKMGAAQIENLLILETFNFSWNNHKEILPILSEQILWQCHQFCQNSDSLIKPFKFQVWPTLTINFWFFLVHAWHICPSAKRNRKKKLSLWDLSPWSCTVLSQTKLFHGITPFFQRKHLYNCKDR